MEGRRSCKFISAGIGSVTRRAGVPVDIVCRVGHRNACVNSWSRFYQVGILACQITKPGWGGLRDVAFHSSLLVRVGRTFQDAEIGQVILDNRCSWGKTVFDSPVDRMCDRLTVIDGVVQHPRIQRKVIFNCGISRARFAQIWR